MHKRRATLSILFLGNAVMGMAQSEGRWTLDAPGGIDYDPASHTGVATNGITVRYGEAVLTADQGTVNEATGEMTAEGNVRLLQGGQLWRGDSLHYNFYTRQMLGQNLRAGQGMFFARSAAVAGEQTENVYVGINSLVTTDDYAKPSYSVRAKNLVIVPGQYLEANHATLYLGKVPVFYYPYYRRSLRLDAPRLEFVPGYRTLYGPYLLTSYKWTWTEQLDGTLHFDIRQKRGVAGGPDFDWRLGKLGEGGIRYYYLHDEDPQAEFPEPAIPENRQRLWFAHELSPMTNLMVKGVVRYQGDPLVLHDFFESEFRRNVQPSTYVEADKVWSNYSLDLLAMPRINPFWDTVERLPDLRLTGWRQQIGGTPFYYESESSLGYYRHKFADSSTNLPFAAFRADTYHQVLYPQTYLGFLNLTPRVGGRFTHYGEADDAGATTSEQERGIFNTGAEASFRASRVWPGVRSRTWDLNGVRHIIEPSVNYSWVPHPTAPPARLPQFDSEVPTTRLLPIEFPDYNAIDAIDAWSVVRFGLRNRLQTKRAEGLQNMVHWALLNDWRLAHRADQPSFSDLYSDLELRPRSWLTLGSQERFGWSDRRLHEAFNRLTVSPNDVWSVSLGHRYLDDPESVGVTEDNRLYTSIYYKLNENWGFRASHQYQAEDGTLEEQIYSVYHDFRSWTSALSVRFRDNRTRRDDFTIAVTFSLKAFPRYSLGDDANKPSLLLGY